MNELDQRHRPLFELQRLMWFLFAVAYGVATILYVVQSPVAEFFMIGTTLVLLIVTGVKLILIGSAFYRQKLTRHLILTVLLLLVLASVALLEIFK